MKTKKVQGLKVLQFRILKGTKDKLKGKLRGWEHVNSSLATREAARDWRKANVTAIKWKELKDKLGKDELIGLTLASGKIPVSD